MQFKCPPCNALNDSSANAFTTAAFPDTKRCDRKCCDETTTTTTAAAASTTCQPKTSEWPSPPAQPSSCDYNETTDDADCWVTEQCDDDPCYRSPQRSNRLFSPVIPTKPKLRSKREKKGIGIGVTTSKPITSTKSSGEEGDETKRGHVTGHTTGSGVAAGAGTEKPTKSKSGSVEAVTAAKSKSPKTSPRATTTRKPTSPSIQYLRRRSNKRTAIDWRKPPKIPIKHTATSKARNENWFADCGRYRVKAYRGDWDNLPDELSADYELYERFFKHRKPAVKKNTSLVKKLVEGKIDLRKPRIENKPFRKRSPVLPTAGAKPKRKSKLKMSSPSFRFGVRSARANLRQQPLIQVRHTFTSSMRGRLDGHSCQKSPMPTYWHGSVEEMQQLKRKIDQRRGQLRNYWKKNDDRRQRPQQRRPREKPCRSDGANNLVVVSSNPSTVLAAEAHRKTEKRTRPVNDVSKYRKSKDSSPQPPYPVKLTANEVRNFRDTIAVEALPASESVVVSGGGHGRRGSRRHRHRRREPQTTVDRDANADTEKWTQPPAIPIRYSLTAIMRQRSTNKFDRNTLKGATNIIRVAR